MQLAVEAAAVVLTGKVKVKFTVKHSTKFQREVKEKLYSFFNFGTRWDGWSASRPRRFN